MLKSLAPRNLPVWLNEGLAVHFEGRDGLRSGRRLAAASVFVPLAELRTSFTRLSDAEAFFFESGSLVLHFDTRRASLLSKYKGSNDADAAHWSSAWRWRSALGAR